MTTQPAAPAGARWLYAPSGRLRAPWRLALYALAFVAGLAIAQGLAYPILAALARLVTARPSLESWLALTAAVVAHVLVLRVVERRPIADVGLGRRAASPALLATGALLGAAAIGVPCALLLAGRELREVAAPAGSWGAVAGSLLAALAPAALFEELFVRGYPLLVLTEALGAPAALVITSVVFGALHLQNPNATLGFVGVVALAGIFLGAIRLTTGSLWAAFAAHLAWNWTLAAGFHAAVSGLPFATPGYRLVDAGPAWLTGGAWGPEGGAAAVAGMCGGLALLWWRAPRAMRDSLIGGDGRRTPST
ncbi:MAG TPA: CPBP family intramembrane glutamic endopeptidase [Gemmatirosa sp.]